MPVFISDAQQNPDSEFNFDVIFVIDGSGSMAYSDPEKISITAASLFVDMLSTSDSRAGFVLYSHRLRTSQSLTSISTHEARMDFKHKLEQINFPTTEDTDIALGLREAQNIFRNRNMNDVTRKPLIILLSDGNTDLPKGPRTKEESEEELEVVKMELASAGIPIYTIGLNYDGSLDLNTMNDIAAKTNALAREAKEAKQLPDILSEIYADQFRANIVPIHSFKATGDSQEIIIPIPNQSIYEANIIILSGKPVMDISLYTPNGMKVEFSAGSNAFLESSEKYALIKVRNPDVGDWVMNLTGADGDDVTIGLLSLYDLSLRLTAESLTVEQGEYVNLRVYLADFEDEINDLVLYENAIVTLITRNQRTGQESLQELAPGELTTNQRFEEVGAYTLSAMLNSADMSKVSNAITIEVIPLALTVNDHEINFITFFKNIDTVRMDSIGVTYPGRELELSVDPTTKPDYVSIILDMANESFDVSIGSIGIRPYVEHDIIMEFYDQYGQHTQMTLRVTSWNGYYIFIIIALLLSIIALLIIMIKIKNRPTLDVIDGFNINLEMPEDRVFDCPPETHLSLPSIKKALSLWDLIDYNHHIKDKYFDALADIKDYVSKITFKAIRKNGQKRLEMYVPCMNKYTVLVNGTRVNQDKTIVMGSGTQTNITIMDTDDRDYGIHLGESEGFTNFSHTGYEDPFDVPNSFKNDYEDGF